MKPARIRRPPPITIEDERPRDLLRDRPDPVTVAGELTTAMRDTLRITSPTHFRPVPKGRARTLAKLESLGIVRRDGDGDVTLTDFGLAVRRALEDAAQRQPLGEISSEEVPY